MKKLLVVLLIGLGISVSQASKLSRFIHKENERERAAQARQLREDMDFSDLDFRLQRHYTGQNGERCRLYSFRSHKNPYKHGDYSVCDSGRALPRAHS
jgi:hypothetical protein